jgi:hypothetical protein
VADDGYGSLVDGDYAKEAGNKFAALVNKHTKLGLKDMKTRAFLGLRTPGDVCVFNGSKTGFAVLA